MVYAYIACWLIFSLNLFAITINDHIHQVHCHKPQAKYDDPIMNINNGVMSAIVREKNSQLLKPERKTLFPKSMQEKNFNAMICACSTKGTCLFDHKQLNSQTGRYVEYRKDMYNRGLVIAFVKESSGTLKTAYPLLQYISLQDLNEKKDTDMIYIASIKDQKAKKNYDYSLSVEAIRNASRDGVYLGHRDIGNGRIQYLVDISNGLDPKLFYGQQEERGSIAVETDWINKR